MMFSGSTAPSGWAFCDGTNGTPDLRNQFIVAANSLGNASSSQAGPTFNVSTGVLNESGQYAAGDTGGSATHQLTIAEMPPHSPHC